MAGVLALWQAVRWQALLKEYEEKLHNLEAENKRLSQLVTDYESGRFMRFMAKLKQGRPARN